MTDGNHEFRQWVEAELTRLARERLARGETRDAVLEELIAQNTSYGDVADSLTVRRIAKTVVPSLEDVSATGRHGLAHWLPWMNIWHFIVSEAGHTRVFTETYDPYYMRRLLHRSRFTDIKQFYSHIEVPYSEAPSDDERVTTLGKAWLQWSDRRQYQGLVFSPGRESAGFYNRWRGFAVEPKQGQWDLFRHHITENICRGVANLVEWLFAWMARAVQQPDVQGEVAVVLIGKRGTGKGVFARGFGSLFGEHFVHLVNIRHVAGQFNAHLEDAVVVFLDEVAWRTDRAAESALKLLITEPTLTVEKKGRDVYTAPNRLHLLLATNELRAVPVGAFERRFLVLDVGDAFMQNQTLFGAIDEELRNGGREAMLHDLLHLDFSRVNLRQPPVTAALKEQQVLSFTPAERWWYRKLQAGELIAGDNRWRAEIPRAELETDYLIGLSRDPERSQSAATELGTLLKRLVPDALGSPRRTIGGQQVWHWSFPPLADCRALFSLVMGQEIDWD